jgi:hypothetical protein
VEDLTAQQGVSYELLKDPKADGTLSLYGEQKEKVK